jgi:hypothetical protein
MASPFTRAQTIIAAQLARRAAHPATGLSWSGMPGREPPMVETLAACMARLERQDAALAAFRASPAGRFRAAAFLIYEATGDDRLLSCADRGLDGDAGRAVKLLAGMEGPAADEARAALADFGAHGQRVAA